MNPLVIVAAISFFAGMFGYVLVVFWLRPVAGYLKLKRRIAKDLGGAPTRPDRPGASADAKEAFKILKPVWKKHAAAVNALYEEKLPDWYKMVLTRREESPMDAARHLMALANVDNPQHAAKRISEVKACLKMK